MSTLVEIDAGFSVFSWISMALSVASLTTGCIAYHLDGICRGELITFAGSLPMLANPIGSDIFSLETGAFWAFAEESGARG